MMQSIAQMNDDVEDFTKGCQAKEYDNCDGWHSVINVLFLYRDSKGRHREDEHVEIGVCEYHRKWLVKLHNGFPLEMRGEEPYYAMHDDLFIPFFAQDNTIYTLLQIDLCAPLPNKDDDNEEKKKDKKQKKEKQFMLFNGRGVKPFKSVLCENDDRIKRISVKGIFQTCFQRTAIACACAEKTNECTMFVCETAPQIIETVIELSEIEDEMALDALVAAENGVYKKPAIAYDENDAEKKYDTHDYFSDEPLPAIIHEFFAKKKAETDYEDFVNCTEFIHDNIGSTIIDWESLRKKSPHIGLPLLFQQYEQLSRALWLDDEEAIGAMRNALTDDVLWSVYVMANHELYQSQNEEKNELLKKSARLVELFLENGLGNQLLALAISGERLRDLSIHIRDHHDILKENIFVVQMLVPKYIPAKHLFYNEPYEEKEDNWMTPLEYFEYFSNKTYNINPFHPPGTFEKNADIRQYLLSQ